MAVLGHDDGSGWQKVVRLFRRAFRSFETERTDAESSWRLIFELERDDLDGGYVASCRDIPGAMSQGETADEALSNCMACVAEILEMRLRQQIADAPDSTDSCTRVAVTVG